MSSWSNVRRQSRLTGCVPIVQIRKIASDRLREAYKEIQPVQNDGRVLTEPVSAVGSGNGTESRRKGDLLAEKIVEK